MRLCCWVTCLCCLNGSLRPSPAGPYPRLSAAAGPYPRLSAAAGPYSRASTPFMDMDELWYVPAAGGAAARANLGPVYDASFQSGGPGRLVGRNTEDPATAHWKGYKGGCSGELWVDPAGDGGFRRLDIELASAAAAAARSTGQSGLAGTQGAPRVNIGSVSWASARRVVFVADDGSGRANLYSLQAPDAAAAAAAAGDSTALAVSATRHTARTDFCVRYPAADAGAAPDAPEVAVAYCAGGKLFVSRIGDGPAVGNEVPIAWGGPRAQLERRTVEAEDYLDDFSLHPEGLTLLTIVRGQAFTMGLWDGPALAYPPVPEDRDGVGSGGGVGGGSGGGSSGSLAASAASALAAIPPGAAALAALAATAAPRARLGAYLWDANRVVLVTDASGEDDVEVHWEDGTQAGAHTRQHLFSTRAVFCH